MDIGLIFALFASISFAISVVFIRRGTAHAGESFSATAISAFIGVPFFAAAIFITGEWNLISHLSVRVLVLLGGAGILHFIIGRMLAYQAYRLIGANKASPFLSANPLFTIILSVVFLNESLTFFLVTGFIFVFLGAALITTERKQAIKQLQEKMPRAEITGIITALGGAVCWGASPALVKPAVEELGSPVAGAFVAYVFATLIMSFFYFRQRHRNQILELAFRMSVIPLLIGAIFASIGQMFIYTALSHSPASLVIPVMGTHILFILLFSFLINRQSEVFTLKVITGMVAVVAGTVLLFQ